MLLISLAIVLLDADRLAMHLATDIVCQQVAIINREASTCQR